MPSDASVDLWLAEAESIPETLEAAAPRIKKKA
jgi:hypothetical protein